MSNRTWAVSGAIFAGLLLSSSLAATAADVYTISDRLKLQVVSDNIIRVVFSPDDRFIDRKSMSVVERAVSPAHAQLQKDGPRLILTTSKLKVFFEPTGESLRFEDLAGHTILAEAPDTRTLEAATVQGEKTYHVRQQWLPNEDESLYGLGQHQYGLVNIKGQDMELWQHNTEIAIPYLVSSKGYGIFWDNTSFSKFGDPRDYVPIPSDDVRGVDGKVGGFTTTAYSDDAMTKPLPMRVESSITNGDPEIENAPPKRPSRERAITWEGDVHADLAGEYQFALYANGGYQMWIDGEQVANHWRQNWLPWFDLCHKHFEAGSNHRLKIQWVKDGSTYCTLTWKPPIATDQDGKNTSLWSSVGDGIDYYFVYGPSQDNVLAGYRQLTGAASMMPKWAFGLWQSRQRYTTQQQSLDIVRKFRDLHIPFDNIVQDWMYWREDDWGSHEFDSARFPNPDQWVKDLHSLNARLMISVWGKFYPSTENFKAMQAKGYLYPVDPSYKDWVGPGYPYTFYDAFNSDARALFWKQVNDRLFVKGIDAWWMDATEPDLNPSPPTLTRQLSHMEQTAAGKSARVANAYPFFNSEGVYEGQRAAAPDQRVFILTRSGYAGQQRFAAASWSGDISSTWTAMKKQIAAGLGYAISGMPYWTMDSGGFSVPRRFQSKTAADEWGELNARWFEFATFVPMLRVHGEAPFREMWEFGGTESDCYKAQLLSDRLRYRLLPYIYSVAGGVTHDNGTFLRPLVMDFANDPLARDLNDEYLFGPALLVSPVTEYHARARSIYLPGGDWYDLWTGKHAEGGKRFDAPAPYDQIPVFVRAGSIIPLGPDLQYTTEKPADPLTVFVYTGRDGAFKLYEDDGLTYQYEHGAFTEIPLDWSESTHELTIGERAGQFSSMLAKRTIRIVLVSKDHPAGIEGSTVNSTVEYDGHKIRIKL